MTSATIPPEVLAFLQEMRVPGVLATLRADGSPITSAVWYGLLDGDIIISTPTARPKARNARRDERVSFVVDRKEMPYRGVAIEGVAEVTEDPDGLLLSAIARRYLGDELPDRIRERAAAGDRSIIRIRATRVRPWNFEERPG